MPGWHDAEDLQREADAAASDDVKWCREKFGPPNDLVEAARGVGEGRAFRYAFRASSGTRDDDF